MAPALRAESVRDVLARAAQAIADSGAESPRMDAEVLLAHTLGVGRASLLAHPERRIPMTELDNLETLVARRRAGEPVAYLTGRRAWYDLMLQVSPAVLIPRPETEGVLDRALAWALRNNVRAVCDVGTGSGALAIALARAIPTAALYAIDRSTEALEVARANALEAGVETIRFLNGDLLAPLPAPMDLIVANLPYLGTAEYAALPRDVALFEPRDALVGGSIGFELTALLLAQAPDHLRPGGAIVLEIGPGQAEGTQAAARAAFPESEILIECDYAGLTRYVQVFTQPRA